MSELQLGIFNAFWGTGHPNHLPLLGLQPDGNQPAEWNLNLSLQLLDDICTAATTDQVIEGIHLLLADDNWRPHLVAIIALLKLPPPEQQALIPLLWERLEKSSGVSPQILSVLYLIDADFEAKGRALLDQGFRVNYAPMSPMEHHSARGGESTGQASEKVLSNIRSLLEHQKDNYGWKGRLLRLIADGRMRIHPDLSL